MEPLLLNFSCDRVLSIILSRVLSCQAVDEFEEVHVSLTLEKILYLLTFDPLFLVVASTYGKSYVHSCPRF